MASPELRRAKGTVCQALSNTHHPQSNTSLSSLASSFFKTKIKYNQGKYIDTGHIWREEQVTSSRKEGNFHCIHQEKPEGQRHQKDGSIYTVGIKPDLLVR